MPIEYMNRKGQRYYLHGRTDKRGRLRYHFSQQVEGDLVDEIPEGYEIYEHPNGQVFLRRQRESVIRDEEVVLVEEIVAAEAAVRSFRVDVRDDYIVVYTPDQDVDRLLSILSPFGDRERAQAEIEKVLSYSPEMRFQLKDAEARTFSVERYNYRGRIDDWIPIAGPAPLPTVARRYLYHLGRDSFFTLY